MVMAILRLYKARTNGIGIVIFISYIWLIVQINLTRVINFARFTGEIVIGLMRKVFPTVNVLFCKNHVMILL